MLLEIKKFNERVLRQKAKPVESVNEEIKKLVADMAETMTKNNGIGLSANQVGVLKRVIVISFGQDDRGVLSLINPKIIKKNKKTDVLEEGCLSFPEIYLEIKRPTEIEVEAVNLDGQSVKFNGKGLLARVIQHEVDHLNGILFFNRLSFAAKIKFKLNNLSIKL